MVDSQFFFFFQFFNSKKIDFNSTTKIRFPDCNLSRLNWRPGIWFLTIRMVHVKCGCYKV